MEVGQVAKLESKTTEEVKKQVDVELDGDRPMTRARAKKLALENRNMPHPESGLSTPPAGPATRGGLKETEPRRTAKGRVTRSRVAPVKRGREETGDGQRKSKRARK